MKQWISSKEINDTINTKNVIFRNSLPKFVPGTNTKKTPQKYQKGKPSRNIDTFAWDWSDAVFNIKFKWRIGFASSISVMET